MMQEFKYECYFYATTINIPKGYHKFIHMGLGIYDIVIKAVNICLYFVLICKENKYATRCIKANLLMHANLTR